MRGGLRGGGKAEHLPPACWTAVGGLHSSLAAPYVSSWNGSGVGKKSCGDAVGQLRSAHWWCKGYTAITLTLTSIRGNPPPHNQVPTKRVIFGIDSKIMVGGKGGIKKASQNHRKSLTCPDCHSVGHTWHVVVQCLWFSPAIQYHHQRTAVARLKQFAAPQAACWECCMTPPTAGPVLPDTHDG